MYYCTQYTVLYCILLIVCMYGYVYPAYPERRARVDANAPLAYKRRHGKSTGLDGPKNVPVGGRRRGPTRAVRFVALAEQTAGWAADSPSRRRPRSWNPVLSFVHATNQPGFGEE